MSSLPLLLGFANATSAAFRAEASKNTEVWLVSGLVHSLVLKLSQNSYTES